MDCPGGDPVWEVHCQVWCLELRRSSHGTFHLWSGSLSRYDISILRHSSDMMKISPQEWTTGRQSSRWSVDTGWPTQPTYYIRSRKPTRKKLRLPSRTCTRSCWSAGTVTPSRGPPLSSSRTCSKTSTSRPSPSIWNRRSRCWGGPRNLRRGTLCNLIIDSQLYWWFENAHLTRKCLWPKLVCFPKTSLLWNSKSNLAPFSLKKNSFSETWRRSKTAHTSTMISLLISIFFKRQSYYYASLQLNVYYLTVGRRTFYMWDSLLKTSVAYWHLGHFKA